MSRCGLTASAMAGADLLRGCGLITGAVIDRKLVYHAPGRVQHMSPFVRDCR